LKHLIRALATHLTRVEIPFQQGAPLKQNLISG